MSVLLKIDQSYRHIISIIYRLVIITYGIIIINIYSPKFEWYYYLIAILSYFGIFIILFKKNGFKSILRLIVDYLFISFIIYNLPINNLLISSFLFLPILNSNNHSGNKKSLLLYLIPIILIWSIFKVNKIEIIIPFLTFSIINLFGTIRTKYHNFNEELNSFIDDFFTEGEALKRPHKIYKGVINVFNNSKFILFKTDIILCFKLNNDKMTLINGSKFIWNYQFNNEEDVIQKIKTSNSKNVMFLDLAIEIDENKFEKNICFTSNLNEVIYCYFLLQKNDSKMKTLPFFDKLFTPFFNRLSKVFESYSEQKKLDLLNVIEMDEKINYVTNAISSMHFTRNKLGPIKNYLEMIEDFNSIQDEGQKKLLREIIVKERQKLRTSLDNILDKANYILEKSNNPFNVNDIHQYGNQKLFIELKRIWELYFEGIRPIVKWDISKDRKKSDVKFNLIGLELVFSNWINNMKKYNNGLFSVELLENETYYLICFNNSVKNIAEVEEIVTLFNSENRLEILKRNTHGLIEVKDFLNQMNVHYKMSISHNMLTLELKFIKHPIL